MIPGTSNSSRTQQNSQSEGRALPVPRLWLLLTMALLLVGLMATVVLAGAEPEEPTAFPAWLEPRGIAITDLIGDVPDEILKDMILSSGGGVGTVQYESGKRTGDKVVISTTIHSRIVPSSWAPGGKITNFTCLGQRPFYDHLGTMAPAATLKIYDATGADITSKIDYLHLFSMGTRQPSAGSGAFVRYPQIDYGPFLPNPLPMTANGLAVPPNSGCRIEITGEDIYPITGVWTFSTPKNIQVSILGSETYTFHSYVGPGNVGILGGLMSQMKRRFPDRHEDSFMTVPTGTDHILANLPALPADPYTDRTGPPYANEDRPTGGTYRLATNLDTLGADLIFSAGFPMANTWRDADQAPGSEFLPEMPGPRLFKSPEYAFPPSMDFHPCFTQGDCSGSVLDKVYNTPYDFTVYYLEVRRIKAGPTWVPVKLAGPSYRPGISSEAASTVVPTGTPEPTGTPQAGLNAGINLDPPDLYIAKEIEPQGSVALGSEVTFTVRVSNTTSVSASVTVTDTLPSETVFARWVVSPTTGASADPDEVQWSGTVTNGEVVTLTFVASQTAGYGRTVTNTAQLGGDASKLAEASFTVEASPTLVITKEVTPQIDVGYLEPVTYTVVLRNEGPSTAYGLWLTDSLPGPVSFNEWAEPPPANTTVVDDEIRWSGDLSAGTAVTFTWVASQTATYGQGVDNTAEYSHTTGGGSDSARFVVVTSPTLVITKEVTPQIDVGYLEPVTYTVVLRNEGPSTAYGLWLTDSLPGPVSFKEWAEPPPANTTVVDDEIRWTGDLSAGTAVTFTWVASQTATYGQGVDNTAEYSHTTGGGSDSARFIVEPSPTLDLDKFVSPETDVGQGQPVTYTLVAINTSPSHAAGYVLTDTLHPSTAFAHWVGPSHGATVDGDKIKWTGTVTANDAITLTFVASQTAGYGQTVINTAEFSHTAGSGTAAAEFTVIQPPLMQVTKTVSPAGQVEYGEPLVYTVVVANPGPTDGFVTSLSDSLPAGTSFAAWIEQPQGASEAGGTITWSGIVPAGTAVTLTFSVNQSAAPQSIVTNVASISFPDGSDQAQAATTVAEKPEYQFYLPLVIGWKQVDPPTPTPTPTPIPEVDPPPNSGCPCGWFDSNGRMLDYWSGY